MLTASYGDILKSSYASLVDAFDSERFGHATYGCAEHMLLGKAQYDKAIPYLWCVEPHCADCPGDGCPTTAKGLVTEATCRSGCYTLLGFAERKKSAPDYKSAERYYRKALSLWSENCGALNYLTEFYLQTSNATWAGKTLERLCDACYASDRAAVNATLELFRDYGFPVPSIAACGTGGGGDDDSAGSDDDGGALSSAAVTWFYIGGAGAVLFLAAAVVAYRKRISAALPSKSSWSTSSSLRCSA